VYRRINPTDRRRLHARLAEIARSPDARARHLALSTCGPDVEVALLLEEAAERARRSGAPGMAAEFARHSVRLTPCGDEAASRRALLEMAAMAAAGEIGKARALVDGLIARLPSGPQRAEALIQRFYVENDDVDVGDATLVQALAESAGDERVRGHVLDILGWHRGVFRGDLPAGIVCAEDAVAIAERQSDQQLLVRAEGHLAHMKALAGHPDPVAMARSVALTGEVGTPHLGGGPRAWLAKQLLWAGDVDEARAMFESTMALDAERGYELERPYRLYDLALVECAAGNLELALDFANTGVEVARDAENADAEGWLMYPLALTQAWLGLDTQATASADRLLSWPGRPGHRLGQARGLSVLGVLRLSTGDVCAAANDLARAVEVVEAIGLGHPGALPVLPDAVIAYAAAGRIEEADNLLSRLERQAAVIDRPRMEAMVLHARGTLVAATGEPDLAIGMLGEAADGFDELGLRPDAARCRLAAGRAALKLARRRLAAELLEGARDGFTDIGAMQWAATAAAELERAMPGRKAGLLTPTESRITRLVAAGAKNAEIAAELFLSVATVEAHLTRVYRKLDIRSRTELTRAVHDGTVGMSADEPALRLAVSG
jgi:DNA-binding CsgD family transcriptional regulator